MRMLVIAANGRTGRKVVECAIKRRHDVSIFVRSGEKLPKRFAQLKTYTGDATSFDDISKAVNKHDAVISTIGHAKGSKNDVQTIAITNLIKAIQNTNRNIKIVSLTGTGVRQSKDHVTLIDRILNLVVKIVDSPRITDGQRHAEQLLNSDVNWSVVRVLKLTNSPKVNYALSENGPAKTLVSRAEAAEALVNVAESSKWDKKMPIVTSNWVRR